MNQSNDNIEFIADGEIVGQGKQIKIFADINGMNITIMSFFAQLKFIKDKFCKPSEIDFERGIEESGSDSFVEVNSLFEEPLVNVCTFSSLLD